MSVVASTWDVKRPPRRAGQRSTNGCVQCRRRKIKCDEQKPTCNHCVKQRLTCSWSQRPWKFVDVNEKVSEGYEVLSEPSDHQSPQLTDWIELNPIEYVPKAQYRAWNGKQETESATMSSLSHSSLRPPCSTASKSRIHLVRSPKYTRIPPSVDAGPTTRSQMLIAALYHYLPTNEPKEHRGEHEHPRLTFLNLFNNAIFHPRTSFLAAAIDSFTLAQASLALGDVRLAFAAIRRYSACLSKLNVALTKSRLYNHDDVLLCILVLSILESMRPISQFGGWASHVHGAIKYLQSRGPQSLESRYQTMLFHHAKQASVLWGLYSRQPIPFSGKDWLRISASAPFVSHETRLIDIGTRIPGLLSGSSSGSEYQAYFQELVSVSREIQIWISEFRQQSNVLVQACKESNFPSYFRLVEPNVLSTALKFQNFNDAWYLSTAWTYLYLVRTTFLSLALSGLDLQTGDTPQSIAASVEMIVDHLCQTIPQALSSESGFSGRMSVNLFLRLLTLHFEAQSRREMARWCKDIEDALYTPDQGHAGAWTAHWEGTIDLPYINQVEK